MARELQWSTSGRTAYGARDDTSGGCEAFKDPRDDIRYGHGCRYGHAASCQALIPEARFGRHRVRRVRLQRRPQAGRDPRRGGSKDPDVLAIPADRNTQVFSSLLTPTGSVGALISVHDISTVPDEAASMLPCALSLWIATPLHQVLLLAGPATALQQLFNMKVLSALVTK
jgi:hypothetical protein